MLGGLGDSEPLGVASIHLDQSVGANRLRSRLAKMRPFVLGDSFGGMRFGIQSLGFWQVDQLRSI